MTAYYNEIDPYCAEWLRNLIAEGLIPPGEVDERSIEDVKPDEIKSFTQAHFFAGIGGWALAARLAGWPDNLPLWTGSCPCQPFSAAGKRGGVADERHLWPAFWWLISTLRPPVVAGEQVASKDGRTWLAGVRTDLEALGYAVGAADLCAAGVGAPHIRQRLWWVADANEYREGSEPGNDAEAPRISEAQREPEHSAAVPERSSASGSWRRGNGSGGRLGHPQQPRLEGHAGHGADGHEPGRQPEDAAGSTTEAGGDCGLSDADGGHASAEGIQRSGEQRQHPAHGAGFWEAAKWTECADGKARRIEPGIEPLVDGFPGRVDQVRAYGNSICPQEAAEFLMAFVDAA